MSVRYLIAAAGACAGACILFAFACGYHQGAEKIKRDIAIQAAAQAEDARQKEKDMQARLNGITENYLHEIDEYKKTMLAGCQARMTAPQQCPQRPALSPVLSATPEPIYAKKLRSLWLSEQSATSLPSGIEH